VVSGPELADLHGYLPPPRGGRAAKWCSAAEAVARIPEGSRVFLGTGPTPPIHLVQALCDLRHRWRRLEIVMPMVQKPLPLFEHAGRPFGFVSTQASPALRELWPTGHLQVLATRFSDYAALCGPDGPLPCDVALVTVSPPAPEGRVSLGVSVGSTIMPALTAPLVIAQVNAQMPYTFGAGELVIDQFDALVEGESTIVDTRAASGSPDEVVSRIAELAAEAVPDHATIQFGIGTIPDAILGRLHGRRGLRVHSGLVTEACADLYEAGVVEGVMVAGEVVSSDRMRAWVHRNPAVLMGPPGLTHGAGALANLSNFVAVNSAVEIALDGSANSEVAAGEVISGPGGAPDFAFGAGLASGGRSILALRATAARGAVSRIVRRIEPPHPVTLPAYLADVLVTEHGRAELRGLAGGARAEAVRQLADPAHRDALS
jgi:acetyl-CoA hydrolase